MTDALLAEVTRGGRVESRHVGAAVIADGDGRIVYAAGDIEAAEFPRSAVKAILALPLVESGAADRLGLTPGELALACSSHAGQDRHVALVASMLGKVGLDETALECGVHWPTSRKATLALAAKGSAPCSLHNNCSGKHAGFLCLASDHGIAHARYVEADHPVMRIVTSCLGELTGASLDERNRAVDGCAIPTYAISLAALATGFARFGSGQGLSPGRAAAAARLREACAADPFLVAGDGRFDTRLMELAGPAVFSKIGAEGVVAACLPELGLGLAVKCRDGSARAAEVAMVSLLCRYLPMTPGMEALLRPTLPNWNGTVVGGIVPGL